MTELDLTILAIIARDGPLSAYDVRKRFASSLTPMWSSSTGSVYPSIRRLGEAGLVRISASAGARSRRDLEATGAGRSALERWLTDVTPEQAAPTPDPVRTRMYFLALLDRERRGQLVNGAIRGTTQAIEEAEQIREKRLAAGEDALQHLASAGVLYELRARLAWLLWLSGEMGEQE